MSRRSSDINYILLLYILVTEVPLCVLKDDYNPTLRIIKGAQKEYTDYSFYVNFTVMHHNATINGYDKQNKCGGSILSKRWILTAAHCCFGMNTDLDILIYGYNNYKVYSEDICVVTHENYTRHKNNVTLNDIALIRLEDDIDLEKYNIGVIQILKTDQDIIGKQAATIGIDQDEASRLLEAHLTVLHTTTCQELCKKKKISSEFHICGYDNITSASSCYGDSGGPLLLGEYQIGVNSFNCWDCGASDLETKPAVFTRTSLYHEWIYGIIDGKYELPGVCSEKSPWKSFAIWNFISSILVIFSFSSVLYFVTPQPPSHNLLPFFSCSEMI